MNYKVKFDGFYEYNSAEKAQEAFDTVTTGNVFRNGKITLEEDGLRLNIFLSNLIPAPYWEDCIVILHQISAHAKAGKVGCSYEGDPYIYIAAKNKKQLEES